MNKASSFSVTLPINSKLKLNLNSNSEVESGREWYVSSNDWLDEKGSYLTHYNSKGTRPNHLNRSAMEPKYRSRLCTHWETNGGIVCPMKKKMKCDFAHGPLELRIKDNRRDRWDR